MRVIPCHLLRALSWSKQNISILSSSLIYTTGNQQLCNAVANITMSCCVESEVPHGKITLNWEFFSTVRFVNALTTEVGKKINKIIKKLRKQL